VQLYKTYRLVVESNAGLLTAKWMHNTSAPKPANLLVYLDKTT